METYPNKSILPSTARSTQTKHFFIGLPSLYFFNEIEKRKMTDNHDQTTPRGHRSSSGFPPTIPEEPSSNSTISALVTSTPLIDPTAVNNVSNGSIGRPRRRSSVSIIQALVHANHSIPTKDVRNR